MNDALRLATAAGGDVYRRDSHHERNVNMIQKHNSLPLVNVTALHGIEDY